MLPEIWFAAVANYKLEKIKGEGSFGQVVQARCKVTNQPVAIKLISDIGIFEYDFVKVVREI